MKNARRIIPSAALLSFALVVMISGQVLAQTAAPPPPPQAVIAAPEPARPGPEVLGTTAVVLPAGPPATGDGSTVLEQSWLPLAIVAGLAATFEIWRRRTARHSR